MANETFEKIEDTVVETYQKIEDCVVGTYKKIEDSFTEKFLTEDGDLKTGKLAQSVVDTYKKVEDGVVGSFTKMADKFVDKFLTREGETVEEAKQRMAAQQEKIAEENQARMEASLEASKNVGKH